jgi:hypothetical protein
MALANITISANAALGGTNQFVVTISSTPPAVPAQGNLWFNQDIGRLLVYYIDANSSQWVQV